MTCTYEDIHWQTGTIENCQWLNEDMVLVSDTLGFYRISISYIFYHNLWVSSIEACAV